MLTALVVNIHSRRSRNLFFRSLDLLKSNNVEINTYHPVENPDQMQIVIKELIDKNYERIIVGGGDGTISSIVSYFAYKNIILGILPLGTSNSFVRSLNIPVDLEKAIKVIEKGEINYVDLGQIDNQYFANTATIGLSARVANTIDNKLKRFLGKSGYVIQGIKIFTKYKPFEIKITTDGKVLNFSALEILIANGPYFGGAKVIPDADPKSHNLIIMAMKGENKWNLAKIWFLSIFGKHTALEEVIEISTKEAIIETIPLKNVDIDGEIAARTPIKVKLASKALKIYC